MQEQELYLTVAEAAQILKCSEDSVSRMFGDVPGVVDLGSGETRNKRRYRVLRIPIGVFNREIAKRRIQ